jgi:hypothetical protein
MPLFEKTDPKNKEENGFDTNPPQTTTNQKPSGIITTLGSLLPFAPLIYEQFTGQKMPQMTGTIAEIQVALVNLQTGIQTLANNQQQLNQRLTSLETTAVQQLSNLTHQFKNLRLTHTKEQKQIELHDNSDQDIY